MTKYIFVTGGVVSGLGKGITAASLGRLLKQRGLRVRVQKLDPYLNVDPGTMSPYQHGEVFVTDDGADEISERHRHRYEFNNDFRETVTGAGLVLAGLSPDGQLVEMVELPGHPWFVGVQFHPELKSRPNRAHPLFRDFVAAAAKRKISIG